MTQTKITNKKLDEFIASIRDTLNGDDIELAQTALKWFVVKIVVLRENGNDLLLIPVSRGI